VSTRGRIGRYEVETELGRGSMGVVYLARDPDLERLVAVKTILLPHGLVDAQRQEFEERFLREARAAGGLTHPGIVTIYEYDRGAGRDAPYMVMEYIPGRSLEQILRTEGALAPDTAFAIVDHLAAALEAAHRAGVVHRDIKPANILLRKTDDAVKITDFGIARLHDSSLTRAGGSIGSPAYMAPEQFRGGHVDARADLFALAVVLYEALSGRRPFPGEDPLTIAASVVHDVPPPISSLTDAVSPAFDRFFERALAKDPSDRFPDAETFRRELDRARRTGGAAARPPVEPPIPRGRRLVPIVAGAAVLAALVIAFVLSVSALVGGPTEPNASDAAVRGVAASSASHPSVSARLPREEPARPRSATTAGVATSASSPAPSAVPRARIVVDTRSGIKDGRLTLSVDGREVYRRDLEWQGGGFKRAMARTVGHVRERHEQEIEIPAGRHEIVARVDVASGTDPLVSDPLVVDLDPSATRTLRVVAGRTFGPKLKLALE
jgi:serine/threonine-protein kinase